MNTLKEYIDSFFLVFGLVVLAVLLFTTPALLIWNIIISPKFELPMFTFWEMFFTLLIIKMTFPSKNVTKQNKW